MTNEARAWSWCTAAKSSPCSPQLEKAHIVAMMTQHSPKQVLALPMLQLHGAIFLEAALSAVRDQRRKNESCYKPQIKIIIFV
ncbi:hypothetical protein MJT46_018047 [Ovis ammon polii x Ovis aries]|nr:hypothetical protein MJT46_018047 [Ovis ammon polii x Ovis aries]